MFSHLVFPDAPPIVAKWQAIYLEPIINSGERITILIVIQDQEFNLHIHSIINESTLEFLYSDKALQIKGLIEHIKKAIELGKLQWQPPFSGVSFSEWFPASDYSMNGILNQAINQSSSLALIKIEQEIEIMPHIANEMKKYTWLDEVKNILLLKKPQLSKSFEVDIKVNDHMSYKYDFSSRNYTANIAGIQTKKVQTSLLRMQLLAIGTNIENKDFIIQTPTSREYKGFSQNKRSFLEEQIGMFESVLKSHQVTLFQTDSAIKAADRILSFVA